MKGGQYLRLDLSKNYQLQESLCFDKSEKQLIACNKNCSPLRTLIMIETIVKDIFGESQKSVNQISDMMDIFS